MVLNVICQRVEVAKPRVESLNPQVTVKAVSTSLVSDREGLDAIVRMVDLVCLTDSNRGAIVSSSFVIESCVYVPPHSLDARE